MKQISKLLAWGIFSTVMSMSALSLNGADTQPDNSKINERDRNDETLTPGDQSNTEADRDITQKIRKSIVKDKSLSTVAKNVKIITVDGKVTLRGPVNSETEKKQISDIATKVAAADHVDNQLEVKSQDLLHSSSLRFQISYDYWESEFRQGRTTKTFLSGWM